VEGTGRMVRARCWDVRTERIYRERGEPVDDCILQNRAELLELCRFMRDAGVRSYLEIGLWTGRLISELQRLFSFDPAAGCDDGWCRRFGLELRVPEEVRLFAGDSGSAEFAKWRRRLGHIDLVFIDADHTDRGVRRDFEIQRAMSHRFLAFHDMASDDPRCRGVVRFWRSLREGYKAEIVLPFAEPGLEGKRMGIGIWSAREDPAAYLPAAGERSKSTFLLEGPGAGDRPAGKSTVFKTL